MPTTKDTLIKRKQTHGKAQWQGQKTKYVETKMDNSSLKPEKVSIKNYPEWLITQNVNKIEKHITDLLTANLKTYREIKGSMTAEQLIAHLVKNYSTTQSQRNDLDVIAGRFK